MDEDEKRDLADLPVRFSARSVRAANVTLKLNLAAQFHQHTPVGVLFEITTFFWSPPGQNMGTFLTVPVNWTPELYQR